MRYNLQEETQADQAFEYLSKLSGKHAIVEITEKKPQRSLPQNSFFHLLVSFFGLQQGYSPNESKTVIKRHMSDVFVYEKNGEKFMHSSADLNKDEMTQVIDRLYRLAADMGVSLPLCDNEESRSLMSNAIEQNKY